MQAARLDTNATQLYLKTLYTVARQLIILTWMMPPKQMTGMGAGIFSLEGNIGSGKSTFLKVLARDISNVEMLA